MITTITNIARRLMVIIVVVTGLALVLLCLPLALPYLLYKALVFESAYKRYLKTIDGAKFFCYSNRADNKAFIEQSILPRLPADVVVVFYDGKDVHSPYEPKYIAHAIDGIGNKKNYPYLLIVQKGKIIGSSINNELYNSLNQGKDTSEMVKKIGAFFDRTGYNMQ